MTSGDKLNLSNKKIMPDTKKDATNGYEYYNFTPLINTGVLSSYGQIKNLLGYDLVDNAGASSVKSYSFNEKGDGYEINFGKTKDTEGYWKYVDGNIDQYSALKVSMSIVPVKVSIKGDTASGNLNSSNAFMNDLINYGLKAQNVDVIPLALKDDKNTPEDESKWMENANKTEISDEIKGYTGIWSFIP
ncbi:hypothetical protein [Clostridium sp.]